MKSCKFGSKVVGSNYFELVYSICSSSLFFSKFLFHFNHHLTIQQTNKPKGFNSLKNNAYFILTTFVKEF